MNYCMHNDADLKSARWDITDRCNLNCIHCSAKGQFKEARNLSEERAFYLLDIIWEKGIKNLTILGGEPFLYPHIYSVLSHACDLGFNVDITTNGTMIDYIEIDNLINIGLRSIFFSIDGSMPSINDAIRGPDVFKKTSESIGRLSELRESKGSSVYINVNTVLNKINSSNIPQIVELCSQYNIDCFKLSDLDLAGNALYNSDVLRLNRAEKIRSIQEIMKIIPNYPHIDFDILSSNPRFLEFLYENYDIEFPISISGCKACRKEIYIDPSGVISPCVSIYQDPLLSGRYTDSIFNLKDLPLSEHRIYREFKDNYQLIKDTYSTYTPCKTCPYLTTLCYPCPLGSSNEQNQIELCCIAEDELSKLGLA